MRPKIIHPVGTMFGMWRVVGEAPQRGVNTYSRVECTCGSGVQREVLNGSLRAGKSTSCGCVATARTREACVTHGLSRTPIHRVWVNMLQRCENPGDPTYNLYGGKGITVSDDWKKLENFFRDMGHPPFKRASIERIDNLKGYSRENCRWATDAEQARNRSSNVWLTYRGIRLLQTDWAHITGLSAETFIKRRALGWSHEQILTTPTRKTLNPKEKVDAYVLQQVQRV